MNVYVVTEEHPDEDSILIGVFTSLAEVAEQVTGYMPSGALYEPFGRIQRSPYGFYWVAPERAVDGPPTSCLLLREVTLGHRVSVTPVPSP
jgi:hypothetical protein